MLNIIYRPATQQDAATIANLMLQSSGGDAEFLWHDLVPGKSITEMMRPLVEKETGLFTYKKSIVAEIDGQVVGLMHACVPGDVEYERNYDIPKERLEHVRVFFELEVPNSYVLLYLSVAKNYQNKGIGHHLLELFEKNAKKNGKQSLSVQVWADNTNALRLYYSLGYVVVQQGDIARHKLLPHDGGILLLKKIIAL
jgi:ribosomal protein S18 acetylase RimI-like enzyme